ncbi:MAG: hypothetical protein ACPGWR_02425 [Ardenticatenaceae bacterium]
MKLKSRRMPDSLKEVVIEELNEALSHLTLATSGTENLNDNAVYDAIVEASTTITAIRNVLQRSWFDRHSK